MEAELFTLKQQIFRPHAVRNYNELLRNQFLSLDELSDLNWRKRKQILYHAYHTVPYYKETFQKYGLSPEDIKKPEDWEEIPILSRSDIVKNFNRLRSTHSTKNNSVISSTGGSTGNPLKVLHDRRYPYETLGWRMMNWWGISPGSNAAYIRLLDRTKKIHQVINKIMWWPTQRIWLNAFSIDQAQMIDFIKLFNIVKPALLQGYVANIFHFASFIEKNSIPIHSPKGVWVTSCPITLVERTLIQKVFKAPVYDQYGCGEVYWLAAQCREQNALHINHDSRLIEFLNGNGIPCKPGELGRVIITDFENRVFPIIRYENGDAGRWKSLPCSCGITLPLMDAVEGRIDDLIRLPDGTVISGLTTLFDEFPEAIKSFQIIQSRDYTLHVNIIPNENHPNLLLICQKVTQNLKEIVRHKVSVELNLVNEIKHTRGKLRFIMSDIS